jgi:hypothetical protein
MMEVCERFGMKIPEYRALSRGERVLYDRHVLLKLELEAKNPVFKLAVPRK